MFKLKLFTLWIFSKKKCYITLYSYDTLLSNDPFFTILSFLTTRKQQLASYRYECKPCDGNFHYLNYKIQLYFSWKCILAHKKNVIMYIINNSHFICIHSILNPFPVCMYRPRTLSIYRDITIYCSHISIYYYHYCYYY